MPFVELVDQLIHHFQPESQAMWQPKGAEILKWGEIFVWLDVFAINQNEGASQGDDLAGQLKEVVEDAEQTLMILDDDDEDDSACLKRGTLLRRGRGRAV